MTSSSQVADAVPLVDVRAAYLAQQAELEAAVAGVVGTGGFILGPEVEQLEAELVRTLESRRAIAVSSGTDASRSASWPKFCLT